MFRKNSSRLGHPANGNELMELQVQSLGNQGLEEVAMLGAEMSA